MKGGVICTNRSHRQLFLCVLFAPCYLPPRWDKPTSSCGSDTSSVAWHRLWVFHSYSHRSHAAPAYFPAAANLQFCTMQHYNNPLLVWPSHQNQGGVVYCCRPCCKTFDPHANSLGGFVSRKASSWSFSVHCALLCTLIAAIKTG